MGYKMKGFSGFKPSIATKPTDVKPTMKVERSKLKPTDVKSMQRTTGTLKPIIANEGPRKLNSMMEAKVKQVEKPINPDSSSHLNAVPTFSDQVSTANIDMRNKKAATPKKVKHKDLKKVVNELQGAVKAHGKQAKTIDKHIDDMNSPMTKKGKCSCYDGHSRVKGTAPCAPGSCKKSPASKKLKPCQKAAAEKKFDPYPSAYANMWASNHKC